MKNRIDEIYEIKKSLDKEIELIRENCTHDEYHIGIFSWRVGCYELMRFCENCYSTKLGMASDIESEEYYSEMTELKKKSEETGESFSQGVGSKIYKKDNEL
jgi:hypothetical protein